MSLPSAAPTGSSGSAAAWLPLGTAMTSPVASEALKTRWGRRSPRPSRKPPCGPRIDSTGTPTSRIVVIVRRADRSVTPSRSASSWAEIPGRFCSRFSASRARAVGPTSGKIVIAPARAVGCLPETRVPRRHRAVAQPTTAPLRGSHSPSTPRRDDQPGRRPWAREELRPDGEPARITCRVFQHPRLHGWSGLHQSLPARPVAERPELADVGECVVGPFVHGQEVMLLSGVKLLRAIRGSGGRGRRCVSCRVRSRRFVRARCCRLRRRW